MFSDIFNEKRDADFDYFVSMTQIVSSPCGGKTRSFIFNCADIHCVKKRLRTSSVFEAEVGEPPHVTQSHGVAQARQDELRRAAPVTSLRKDLTIVSRRHRRRAAVLQGQNRVVFFVNGQQVMHNNGALNITM